MGDRFSERWSTFPQRVYETLIVLYPRQKREENGEEMRRDHRESYEDARAEGVFEMLGFWRRELWSNFVGAVEERLEHGQGRQLVMVGLSLALAFLAYLYSRLSLATGVLSFAVFGLRVYIQSSSPTGWLAEAQIPLYAADVLQGLIYVGVAWFAMRFARSVYAETLEAEAA